MTRAPHPSDAADDDDAAAFARMAQALRDGIAKGEPVPLMIGKGAAEDVGEAVAELRRRRIRDELRRLGRSEVVSDDI